MPDRGWSHSAPLPDPTLRESGKGNGGQEQPGRHGSRLSPQDAGGMGLVGGGGGGGAGPGRTEYVAPVPRHHRQQQQQHQQQHQQHQHQHQQQLGGGGRQSAPATAAAAAAAAAAALTREFTGGGSARWDRDPVRDTMAFATMKYPPGSFPPGGVYGEGAIFEQVRVCVHNMMTWQIASRNTHAHTRCLR